jgi:hypothetical protein
MQVQDEAPGDVKVEKGHGRVETRRVWVTDRVNWMVIVATIIDKGHEKRHAKNAEAKGGKGDGGYK